MDFKSAKISESFEHFGEYFNDTLVCEDSERVQAHKPIERKKMHSVAKKVAKRKIDPPVMVKDIKVKKVNTTMKVKKIFNQG